MRARVLNKARAFGLDVHENRYEVEAILQAKGAFITNALIDIRRLTGLDFAKNGKANFDQIPPAGLMAQLLSAPGAA
jgi:branched-subunit amino acid aminotransferase/4-amino-4-deoxychorismate lyase